MNLEGEYYITSEGRRFVRSMTIEDTIEPIASPLIPEDFTRSLSYEVTQYEEERYNTSDLIKLLQDLRNSGPIDADAYVEIQEAIEWLRRNHYVRFVPYER